MEFQFLDSVRQTKIILEIWSLKNCKWQWSTLHNMNLRFCFIATKWTVFLYNTHFITDTDLCLSKQGIMSRYHAKFISSTEPGLRSKHCHARSFFHILAVYKLEWEQKSLKKQGLVFSINIFTPTPICLWPECRQRPSYGSTCCAGYLGQNTIVSQLHLFKQQV